MVHPMGKVFVLTVFTVPLKAVMMTEIVQIILLYGGGVLAVKWES